MRKFLSFLAVLGMAGCSAGGGYADRAMTAELVEETVLENHDRVNAILGSGTISVETPEIAQSVSFELTLRKPDSVMVRIEGPFGIDLGLALVTRDEFQFYNSMSNELLTGPTNATNLGHILRVRLEFDDLLNLFSGGVFLQEDRGRSAILSIEDEEYVLMFRNDKGTRRYRIEPRSFQIVGIEHRDRGGNVFLEQSFGNFVSIEGVTLPRLVRVTAKQERRRLSLAYSHLSVNPASLHFHFDIPPNADRARME